MANRSRPVDCVSTLTPPADLAPDQRDRLVAGFRALGDATRLEMFRLLAAQTAPLCVCDIVARFDLSQPTISHHLKILRDAGLVTVSRRGVWAYYAVDPSGLALLEQALAEFVPGRLADVS